MNAKWGGIAAGLLLFAAGAGAAEQPASGAAAVIEQFGLEQAATPVSERPGWRKPQRILVLGSIPRAVELLQPYAPGVELVVAKPGEEAKQAANVDALIGLCNPAVLAAGNSIKWIQMLSAGVERCVSIPAVRERDILVTNMQRISGPVIAEHVMAMALGFVRGIDGYVRLQEHRDWQRNPPPGRRMSVVQGKTMLVVGLGGIGTEVARRAHALGMKVTATRNSSRTGPEFVSYVGLPDELTKLAAQADFVVNCAPLTPETTGIFDAKFFAQMKPTAYFINIARGGSVVTSALLEALTSNKIAGAGLDVTDPEPLPADHPLWKAPNVIITPHIANESDLGSDTEISVAQENLRRYVAGERMLSVVDVSRGY
ncbi:MAG TPA: D-2-hydroxyacid dehydrogenase [Steroidobacteraceae bacterium]|nr:D-2-hydroxyacid dehydrogenase [Steroidobacteraceae bacterium]